MNSKPNINQKLPFNFKKINPTVTYVQPNKNQTTKTSNQSSNNSRPTSNVGAARQIKITHPIKPAYQVDLKKANRKILIQEPYRKQHQKNKQRKKLEMIRDVVNLNDKSKIQQKLQKIKNILFSKKKYNPKTSQIRTSSNIMASDDKQDNMTSHQQMENYVPTNKCQAPQSNYKSQFFNFKTNQKQNRKETINSAVFPILSSNQEQLPKKIPQSEKLRFTEWSHKNDKAAQAKKLSKNAKLPVNEEEQVQNLLSPFAISQKKNQNEEGRMTVTNFEMLLSDTKEMKTSPKPEPEIQ